MNKSKSTALRLKIFVLIACLLTTSVQIKAQDILAADELLLKNTTPLQVKFYLRKGDANWGAPIYLNSGGDRVFKDVDQIWIEGVHRKIELTVRYKIVWVKINKTFNIIPMKLR